MILPSSSFIRFDMTASPSAQISSAVFTPNTRLVSAATVSVPSLFSGFPSISITPENSVPVIMTHRLFSLITGSVTVKHVPINVLSLKDISIRLTSMIRIIILGFSPSTSSASAAILISVTAPSFIYIFNAPPSLAYSLIRRS